MLLLSCAVTAQQKDRWSAWQPFLGTWEVNRTRIDYWDNEGHVIHYTAEFADSGRKLIMTSDASPPGPRYRLTYLKTGDKDPEAHF